VITILDIDIWTSDPFMQFLEGDKHPTIASDWLIGNTKASNEQPLVGREEKPFHLDGFAILGMFAVEKPADKIPYDAVDIRWNETSTVFSYREGLQLAKTGLGFMVHE
jgi:hypothetical protein